MSVPLSLYLRPKTRTPLGELKVAEEKNSLHQYIPTTSKTDLFEIPRPKEITIKADLLYSDMPIMLEVPSSLSLIRKSLEESDGAYKGSRMGHIKLVTDHESRGSVQRKTIQKAMIAAKQAKMHVSKTLQELKTWGTLANPTEKMVDNSDDFSSSDEEMQSTSSRTDQEETDENVNRQLALENSATFYYTQIKSCVKKEEAIISNKPKNILCLNKLAPTTKNIQLSGFKIRIDEDADEDIPSTGSCMKIVM